jgi:hypothetical protein
MTLACSLLDLLFPTLGIVVVEPRLTIDLWVATSIESGRRRGWKRFFFFHHRDQ